MSSKITKQLSRKYGLAKVTYPWLIENVQSTKQWKQQEGSKIMKSGCENDSKLWTISNVLPVNTFDLL